LVQQLAVAQVVGVQPGAHGRGLIDHRSRS
jgi:hypothetical protein